MGSESSALEAELPYENSINNPIQLLLQRNSWVDEKCTHQWAIMVEQRITGMQSMTVWHHILHAQSFERKVNLISINCKY